MTETAVIERAEPKGIGGWLLLPLVQLIATPLTSIFNIVKEFGVGKPPLASTPSETPVHVFPTLMPAFFTCIGFAFGLYCLWQFLELRRRTPRLMIGWYVLNVLTILATIVYLRLLPKDVVNADPLYRAYSANNHDLFTLAFVTVLNAILIAYFARSRRVQNTFVS